ncbi:MAG: hypothetical protein QOE70_2031 [Chthoniobacter sp.]|jgi:hypothetical protein|nr:hypothetical protein [Chthoniobacter sp.]
MTSLQRLLRSTGQRSYLAALASNFHRAALGAAAAALLALLAARLLSLLPNHLALQVVAAIALLPVIFALATTRRLPAARIARLIDDRMSSKDLFLTATLAGEDAGEFRPIVASRAEERAAEIKPAQVVPFHWQRGLRDLLAAIAVVGVAVWFLPQLDPFKKQAARAKASEQEQRLAETRKATTLRREELKEGRDAEQVQQALTQLEKTFKEAKPLEKEATVKELTEQQKELGEMWKKVSNKSLRDAFDKAAQNFGQADPKKLDEWRKDLQQGDTSSLKKELSEMREQLRQLAGMPDSAEKRALQEQLARRLNEMAQGMKQMASSPQVNEALQRALEQLDLSKLGQMSKEAMEGAMDSLNLSQQELDQLAQSLKDGKQLEEALKNLQMARQLAEQGKLDGAECKACKGMGDYAALFASKMGAATQPGGSQMGPGIGNGAKRPEDESTQTEFKPEKSKSQLAGGKLLLEWKTKEVGETGARTEDYRDALRQVQQGVSEAIQQEQVPPGYHDAIKRYFDTLPEKK